MGATQTIYRWLHSVIDSENKHEKYPNTLKCSSQQVVYCRYRLPFFISPKPARRSSSQQEGNFQVLDNSNSS